jgi:enoyl-[acyl-carrier protein] reductase I
MSGISNIMQGKRGLVMGIANDRSIAWGIAKSLVQQGAEIALSYPSEPFKKRLSSLGASIDSEFLVQCDVKESTAIDSMLDLLKKKWGTIDFVVHAIAFCDKNELRGRYINTSLDNFLNSMHISCYSFTEITSKASNIMKPGGSIITLTYYGAKKVIPHYNVMGVCKAALEASISYLAYDLGPKGIRVNGISAGPVKTLAASAIGDFNYMLEWNRQNAPLRRNITTDEVGNTALFLLSNLSSGITGEIIYADCGYHIIGMKAEDTPEPALPKRLQKTAEEG